MAITDENINPGELPAIEEAAEWVEHLPGIVSGVQVLGGVDAKGPANFQARVLDARTRWLRHALEKMSSGGIILEGRLEDETELYAIDTEGLQVGTAYFVNYALRVWNGALWGDSGSLRGERGLNLLGIWPEDISLPEVEENEIGDAYIWNHDFWVLVPNPQRWEPMGIRGPDGLSAFELWQKIAGNENKTEIEYRKDIQGKDNYQLARENGFNGTQAEWLESLRARNNYELWLSVGNSGTLQEYLATLKSTEPGPKGDSIKGDTGEKGKDGANFKFTGTVANEATLRAIASPQEQDAYMTRDNGHLWVYITAKNGWTDFGVFRGTDGTNGTNGSNGKDGAAGKNLVLKGVVSTFADLPKDATDQDAYSVETESRVYMFFTTGGWRSLGQFKGADGSNGTNGSNGVDGKNGISFIIKGSVETLADLPKDPKDQDLYAVRSENKLRGFIGGSWQVLADFKGDKGDTGDKGDSIKGDKGEDGTDGKDGRNLYLDGTVATVAELPTGKAEQTTYAVTELSEIFMLMGGVWKTLGRFHGKDGTNGTNGTNGKDGLSVIIKGSVATIGDLPTDPKDQDVYAVRGEHSLYAYIQNAWANLGNYGIDGTNGTNGIDGKDGKDGENGRSIDLIKVLTVDDDTIPPSTDATLGKGYLDLEKNVWVNVKNKWEFAGPFNGAPGADGAEGPPLKPRGTVPDVTQLPDASSAENGDMWFTADTKMAYVLVEGQWSDPIDIVGADGKQGPEGAPGALMPILGFYDTFALLRKDHPTGVKGDAYLIANTNTTNSRDLIVWNTTTGDWQNTGPAGIPGPAGPTGADSKVPGPKGDRGTQWLILPEGQDTPSDTFNGRAGDWAVTKNMRVWYKDVSKGWVFWNFLVAGDVNSPLLELGRCVRYGDQWVPEAIGAVPDPLAGKLYAQQLKAGSKTGETEWVEVKFPDITTKDGKQYARVWTASADAPIWQEIVFPKGIADLTSKDGKQYARAFPVNGEVAVWQEIVIPAGITDLVNKDGKQYARVFLANAASAVWQEIAFPKALDDILSADDKQYVRVWKKGASGPVWAELALPSSGIADIENPEAGALYLRYAKNGTWTKYEAAPTTAGLQHVQREGKWVSFDRYDLPVLSIAATATIDPNTNQNISLTNTTSAAKTLTLKNGPSARALTLVITVIGSTGLVGFATEGGTALGWHGGTAPALTGSITNIILYWTGSQWIGSKGVEVP